MLWLAAVAIASGCGDDAPGPSDARSSDATFDGSTLDLPSPALPAPPAPPSMLPCPDGWREVAAEDGVMLCEPWPETGRRDCPAGEVHFPGTPGCAPLGEPCPAGEWPADLPAGRRVWYVRPGSSGDGSIGAPLGSVEAAHDRAADGDVIALAKGTHGRVPLGKDLEVIGACAAQTRVVPGSAADWAVLAMGATATLRDVTVGPAPRFGVVTTGTGTSLTMRGVAVEDTRSGAIVLGLGSRAAFSRVRVRGVTEGVDDKALGITVQEGSTATFDQVAVEGADGGAINVVGAGSTLSFDRVVAVGSSGAKGGCMLVRTGAAVTGSAFVCEDSEAYGVLGGTDGSTIDLTHVVIRRVDPADDFFGRGVAGQGFTDMTLAKVLIEEVTQMGLLMGDADGSLETVSHLSDVVIRNTRVDAELLSASGFVLHGDSTATVERLHVADTRFDGLLVQSGARLDASDVTVRRTEPTPNGGNGPAILVVGAAAAFDRVDVSDGTAAGAAFQSAEVTASNFAVHTTQPDLDGTNGFGIIVIKNSSFEGERLLVEGSRTSQISVQGGSSGRFVDLTLRDGSPEEAGGGAGYGLQVVEGRIDVTRGLIEGHHAFGVLFSQTMGEPSTLEDVVVTDTVVNDCPGCSGHGSGIGAFGAEVVVTGFSLRDNEVCGVFVGPDAGVDLSMGEVAGSAIGACVTDEGYDLARLQSDVEFRDNETNLDSTSLPVPEPVVAPEFSEQ